MELSAFKELSPREKSILSVALTVLYDEVCKTGTTKEMKEDILNLARKVSSL